MSGTTPAREPVAAGRVLIGIALVGVIVLAWLLATPPSGGPDEPTHVIRGAALVRGELDGVSSDFLGPARAYELPAWVGFPDPVCFAFESYTPATCATSLPRPEGEALLETRAWTYQVWGHLLPGLGTLAPASIGNWAARALDALLPIVAVGVALYLAARRSRLLFGATLLAVTPLAWFSFAVVNPSGLVIGGGVGLWVTLSLHERNESAGWLARWLAGVSWAMMALPRRDGLLWAVLVVSIVMLLDDRSLASVWRALGRGPQIVVAASTVATLAWAATSDVTSARLLLATPLVPVAAQLARRAWSAPWMAGTGRRVGALAVVLAVAAALAYVVMDQRTGGYDAGVMRIVIGRTGQHLDEAIGMLGWLDTPIPASLAFVWLLALGGLAAGAVVADDRGLLVAAAATVLVGVVASWVLEMAQGDPTGTYWQGRYSLPFLVGVPIVLGRAALPDEVSKRLGAIVTAVALVIPNVALAAAMRRWAVGIAGPMEPWNWNTYDTPLPPIVLLALSVAASIGLWHWMGGMDRWTERRVR